MLLLTMWSLISNLEIIEFCKEKLNLKNYLNFRSCKLVNGEVVCRHLIVYTETEVVLDNEKLGVTTMNS